MDRYTYIKALPAHVDYLCRNNIEKHPDDRRWIAWMEEGLENYKKEKTVVFVICHDEVPIGEVTLILDPGCSAVGGRTKLADHKKVANINALRIQKEYEGQGHVSKLMHEVEVYAARKGYEQLTIGVEAKETRNLGIYLHWGYDKFVMSELEDGELILYYMKNLQNPICQE